MKKDFINSLVKLSNIEIPMTFKQYKLYRENKLSLLDIKLINALDEDLGIIENKNKRLYQILAGCMAFMLAFSQDALVYASNPSSRVNELGHKLFGLIQLAMKWICLIKAAVDIGKEVGRGGDNGGNIFKIALKYAATFAILILLPELFDFIEEGLL